jgi:hypothetical protein
VDHRFRGFDPMATTLLSSALPSMKSAQRPITDLLRFSTDTRLCLLDLRAEGVGEGLLGGLAWAWSEPRARLRKQRGAGTFGDLDFDHGVGPNRAELRPPSRQRKLKRSGSGVGANTSGPSRKSFASTFQPRPSRR